MNDETQRYCRALRKHLEFTNRKLEAYETGKPFRFFKSREDEIYEFEGDLPDLHDGGKRRKTPVESPKPSTPILNLFMRNKERRDRSPEPIETLPLKSTQWAPTPEPERRAPPPPSSRPPKPPSPPKDESPPPERSPKNSGGGFFGIFSGKKAPTPAPSAPPAPEHDEAEQDQGDEGEKPKGILERIFGKEEAPSPPPKHVGHLKKKAAAPPPPPPEKGEKKKHHTHAHIREPSGPHVNVPTADPGVRDEMKRKHSGKKISVERGRVAEEQARKERESDARLAAMREREMEQIEAHERQAERERKEEEQRQRKASLEAKQERERRLMEATEKARAARANEKVIKGELPTMDNWKGEERIRKESYDRRKAYMEEQERLKKEYVVQEAKAARQKMEEQERNRRAANNRERLSSLEHELEHHHIKPSFAEVPQETANLQKRQQEDAAATKIQAVFRGNQVRKQAKSSSSSSESDSSSAVSSSEDSSEEILVQAPSPPVQAPPPPPPVEEDPWDFDIEERSQVSRSSRQNSRAGGRKKKSIFK